jgi:hypothetical protein
MDNGHPKPEPEFVPNDEQQGINMESNHAMGFLGLNCSDFQC